MENSIFWLMKKTQKKLIMRAIRSIYSSYRTKNNIPRLLETVKNIQTFSKKVKLLYASRCSLELKETTNYTT